MKIGVTGTRSGMNEKQKEEVTSFLKQYSGELHHGDCVGVDVEVADIAKELGYKTVKHPPLKTDLQANHQSDEERKPFSYFQRNRNIVDECDIVIVVPYQDEWQSNGGTWYTYDYALKKKSENNVKLFFPNRSSNNEWLLKNKKKWHLRIPIQFW